jgi:2-aminoadipate transaminase
MDDDGVVPEALEQAIASVRAAGKRIKFFYTIPNFHNPAGVSLSDERRARVLEICQQASVLVLEDNPYGLLGFEGEPQKALRAADREGVIYLGSFSKTFAPGFRVGWAVAPHAVREKLVLAQESATLCPPTFSQLAISSYLIRHDWMGQVKQFREMYRERRDAMLWTRPGGGFYVWLTLPEGLDAKAMLPRAVTARVAYVPGTAFFADGFGSQCMRLSYCHPTPERITEGVGRLAAVINEELELRHTFGPLTPGAGHGYDAPGPELS